MKTLLEELMQQLASSYSMASHLSIDLAIKHPSVRVAYCYPGDLSLQGLLGWAGISEGQIGTV